MADDIKGYAPQTCASSLGERNFVMLSHPPVPFSISLKVKARKPHCVSQHIK